MRVRHLVGLLLAATLFGLANDALAAAIKAEPRSVRADCMEYARRLGSVKPRHCDSAGWYRADVRTVRGRPILLRDIPADALAPRVLVIGGIHGDELAAISIVFGWLERLDRDNPHRLHWRVTPSMNPDGLLDRPSQRMNANGVDLNRNLPTPGWEKFSNVYWNQHVRRDPRRYPGSAALSEPESQWLAAEIERFDPDVIVAVHAPLDNIDFDGPAQAPRRIGHLHLNLLGTYPGSLGNYAGVQRGIPVLTVELSYAGIMPSKTQQEAIWTDLNSWLESKIPRHETPVASGRAATAP